MFSNFYRLDLHNKTRVTLENLFVKNGLKRRPPLLVGYGYRKRMFVDFLTGYIGAPNYFNIECRVVINA